MKGLSQLRLLVLIVLTIALTDIGFEMISARSTVENYIGILLIGIWLITAIQIIKSMITNSKKK